MTGISEEQPTLEAVEAEEQLVEEATPVQRTPQEIWDSVKAESEQPTSPDPEQKTRPQKGSSTDWEKRFKDQLKHVSQLQNENGDLRKQQAAAQQQVDALVQRLDALEARPATPEPPDPQKIKEQEEQAAKAKERQEFEQSFPVLVDVIEERLSKKLDSAIDGIRNEVSSLVKERDTKIAQQDLQRRHQLANQRLGIVNASEIDRSQEWANWLKQSQHRMAIATDFRATDDFVVLLRDYLQQYPQAARLAEKEQAPPKTAPRSAPAMRQPNHPARSTARPQSYDSNSTWATVQELWDQQANPS